jgi:hypothetical protein
MERGVKHEPLLFIPPDVQKGWPIKCKKNLATPLVGSPTLLAKTINRGPFSTFFPSFSTKNFQQKNNLKSLNWLLVSQSLISKWLPQTPPLGLLQASKDSYLKASMTSPFSLL